MVEIEYLRYNPVPKMDKYSLIYAPLGKELVITLFEGGEQSVYKLHRIGLYPGDVVKIIRIAPFRGPLLMETGGREIALGRNVASCVIVELVE